MNYLDTSQIQFISFPDGQRHLRIPPALLTAHPHSYDLLWRIRNPAELLELELIVDAMSEWSFPRTLVIPYLMSGRSDRRMMDGDPCGLRVVANRINSLGFRRVILVDPHSFNSVLLIHNSRKTTMRPLYESINVDKPFLIVPDKGAADRAEAAGYILQTTDKIQCDKVRDPDSGRVQLTITPADLDKIADRNCVIVDDICDGGNTFLQIAEQVGMICASLHLVVTHGIFSAGTDKLARNFTSITTADTYRTSKLPGINLFNFPYESIA